MRTVIVGCGVAGSTAAMTMRENSPETEISIYTDENHLYYPRPRLYEVITGEKQPEEIYTFSKQSYDKRNIKVHLNNKVVGIELQRKELLLQDRSRVHYDKLLLANGAHPFLPPINGAEKTGVFTLRTIEDALAIREYTQKTNKAIVIGGGLLGLEFAAYLRKAGQHVKVVEVSPRLLPRQLDRDGAEILKDKLETVGISSALGVKTKEILGKDTVSGIVLDNGKELAGKLILISAGIRSNISLALEAGIKVNRGVVVDEYLRTSANDVYAAGDAAECNGTVYGIIPPTIEQAKAAAANILGKEKRVYKGTIQTTSLKIAGISLTSMGLVNPERSKYEEIKKINRQKGIYKKIVLDEGEIVGAIILGDTKGVAGIKKLMDQRTVVTQYEDSILEDDFDFRKIFP